MSPLSKFDFVKDDDAIMNLKLTRSFVFKFKDQFHTQLWDYRKVTVNPNCLVFGLINSLQSES